MRVVLRQRERTRVRDLDQGVVEGDELPFSAAQNTKALCICEAVDPLLMPLLRLSRSQLDDVFH